MPLEGAEKDAVKVKPFLDDNSEIYALKLRPSLNLKEILDKYGV